MQAKPISRYIYFGTVFRYLQNVNAEDTIYTKKHVLNHIEKVFSLLKEFKLPVTERAANELYHFKNDMKSETFNDDDNLSTDQSKELKKIMNDIEKTLIAESRGNVAYIVSDKRYDVNKLLSNISELMAPDVFQSLPEIAQYDFNESGKCIAFGLPTSAAFHLLRGTEAVLRDYYCYVYKRNRGSMMWGSITGHLRKRKSPPIPPEVLLNNLDNIRHSFRNPTQHPDKIYDIQEVQDLFGLCIDVVNRMANLQNKN